MNDPSIAAAYENDGFYLPYDVLPESDAQAIRSDLESAEAELADDPERLGLLRSYPAHVLPSFDSLIRHPALVAAASEVLGPDLMVWSSGLFIKEADTPSFVSWHQDLTYWGLDDAEEITAWVALSPSSVASGCMRFVPGSHKQQLVAHRDSFSEDNLLTRGQEIAVQVDDATAVNVILKPGQASLHHGHLFHSSGPNTTSDRRIGAAIRYIRPSMKQTSGDKTLVSHVSGEDKFGHFKVASPPEARLQEADFDLCRADSAIKKRVLYEGAEQASSKRYQ
jgi:ectoine hydroxylase-related dioxygenase (phytanoyl-CoA dioxygenase family)